MTGYDGEGTIPRTGPGESFKRYLTRVYGSPSIGRFIGQGALLAVLSSFPTLAGVLLRGCCYRFLLGGMGKRCFLEKNIRYLRQRLSGKLARASLRREEQQRAERQQLKNSLRVLTGDKEPEDGKGSGS